MLFEIANMYQFPFPVQQKRTMISQIFSRNIFLHTKIREIIGRVLSKLQMRFEMETEMIYVSKFQMTENSSNHTVQYKIHLTNSVNI